MLGHEGPTQKHLNNLYLLFCLRSCSLRLEVKKGKRAATHGGRIEKIKGRASKPYNVRRVCFDLQ